MFRVLFFSVEVLSRQTESERYLFVDDGPCRIPCQALHGSMYNRGCINRFFHTDLR